MGVGIFGIFRLEALCDVACANPKGLGFLGDFFGIRWDFIIILQPTITGKKNPGDTRHCVDMKKNDIYLKITLNFFP